MIKKKNQVITDGAWWHMGGGTEKPFYRINCKPCELPVRIITFRRTRVVKSSFFFLGFRAQRIGFTTTEALACYNRETVFYLSISKYTPNRPHRIFEWCGFSSRPVRCLGKKIPTPSPVLLRNRIKNENNKKKPSDRHVYVHISERCV